MIQISRVPLVELTPAVTGDAPECLRQLGLPKIDARLQIGKVGVEIGLAGETRRGIVMSFASVVHLNPSVA